MAMRRDGYTDAAARLYGHDGDGDGDGDDDMAARWVAAWVRGCAVIILHCNTAILLHRYIHLVICSFSCMAVLSIRRGNLELSSPQTRR